MFNKQKRNEALVERKPNVKPYNDWFDINVVY